MVSVALDVHNLGAEEDADARVSDHLFEHHDADGWLEAECGDVACAGVGEASGCLADAVGPVDVYRCRRAWNPGSHADSSLRCGNELLKRYCGAWRQWFGVSAMVAAGY